MEEWLRFQVISSDITDDSHLVYNILISHAHISFSCQTTVKQTVKNDISMFDLSWQKKTKKFWNMVHEWYSKWKICVYEISLKEFPFEYFTIKIKVVNNGLILFLCKIFYSLISQKFRQFLVLSFITNFFPNNRGGF